MGRPTRSGTSLLGDPFPALRPVPRNTNGSPTRLPNHSLRASNPFMLWPKAIKKADWHRPSRYERRPGSGAHPWGWRRESLVPSGWFLDPRLARRFHRGLPSGRRYPRSRAFVVRAALSYFFLEKSESHITSWPNRRSVSSALYHSRSPRPNFQPTENPERILNCRSTCIQEPLRRLL